MKKYAAFLIAPLFLSVGLAAGLTDLNASAEENLTIDINASNDINATKKLNMGVGAKKIEIWSQPEIKAIETGKFLRFGLYKLESGESGNTLLVVGGVHGDEPGGYFAPALLVTRYKIKSGALWVAPNLNAESVILSMRGVYGDMNRKFSKIKKGDPDAPIVAKIKEILLDRRVDLILNLHDGHGFFRERWENTIFNPKSWGQTIVIDQKTLSDVKFGDMDAIAGRVAESITDHINSDYHFFRVKNTETRYKDEEMRQSLTYFAVTNLKPAFGQETSKNIDALALKTLYHLSAIEEFMRIAQIDFERDFELNLESVQEALTRFGSVKINGKTTFDLSSMRNIVRYVPLKGDGEDRFVFDHPLGAARKKLDSNGEHYDLMIGNKRASSLYPQYFDYDCELKEAIFIIDGKEKPVEIGGDFEAEKTFIVKPIPSIRSNVIGFSKEGYEDESGLTIAKKDMPSKFSVDVRGNIFRVEFYKKNNFCGNINVKFQN